MKTDKQRFAAAAGLCVLAAAASLCLGSVHLSPAQLWDALRSGAGSTAGRIRKYYSLTKAGRELLGAKEAEWQAFSAGVNKVLKGGACLVGA